MTYQLMTVDDLKQALPKGLQHQANQEFADKVNAVAADPETAEIVRNNFLSYSRVLQEGKYKTEDYLNAVTYCTFKIMGLTNKDAYAKTFASRYQSLVLRGASEKDISAYVAAYHKNKLVNTILEQAVIPSWLLNQDVFQRAINTQLELMTDPTISPKVRADAANSLLTHLKAPETKKVELDVSVKNQGGISDLMATMELLAKQQLVMIQEGGSAKEIGRTPLMIEGEVLEVPAVKGGQANGMRPTAMVVDDMQDEPEPVDLNPFSQLEEIRVEGDFEYREDVVRPNQKTIKLSLFP